MKPVKNFSTCDCQIGQRYKSKDSSRILSLNSEVVIIAVNLNRGTITYKYITGALSTRSPNKYERSIPCFSECTILIG